MVGPVICGGCRGETYIRTLVYCLCRVFRPRIRHTTQPQHDVRALSSLTPTMIPTRLSSLRVSDLLRLRIWCPLRRAPRIVQVARVVPPRLLVASSRIMAHVALGGEGVELTLHDGLARTRRGANFCVPLGAVVPVGCLCSAWHGIDSSVQRRRRFVSSPRGCRLTSFSPVHQAWYGSSVLQVLGDVPTGSHGVSA